MSAVVVNILPGFVQDNLQRTQMFTGELTVGPFGALYPEGGIPLYQALLAALFPTTNDQVPHSVELWSTKGSGYIYTYIKATGCMMILQVPPSGSLSTASPLQQLSDASNSLSGVFEDVIAFRVCWRRNASGT
jgi:hypothetical protein